VGSTYRLVERDLRSPSPTPMRSSAWLAARYCRQDSTTQIYTHLSIRELKEIHAATHPGGLLERRAAEATELPVQASDAEELLSSLAAEAAEEDDAEA
jgi:hypothetical protein